MALTDPNVKQSAETAQPTDELGISGVMQFAGMVQEAYIADLYYPRAYDVYNQMQRRDPTLRSLLNAIKLLARPTIWSVEPASSAEADQRAAAFVDECVLDLSTPLSATVEDLLTAIPFGWAWSEIVYKRRAGADGAAASNYADDKIGWRKFAPRKQSSLYRWEFDPNGGTQGMWQWARSDPKLRYLPIEKSLHFVSERDSGNPEGMPLFEAMYEPWHFVKNLMILMGIGFERSFVGLPVFEYAEGFNPGPDDKALVQDIGEGLRADERAYVATPANLKFRLETTTNTNAGALLDTIKQMRIWMLMVVLADFLALGTVASGGSYSLGQDKSELFLMAVDGWLDKIAELFNRYAIPRLFGYNTFPGITAYPQLTHSSVQKPNLPALSAYLSSLQNFINPDMALEAHLRRMADLPKAEEPDADGGAATGGNAPPETGTQQADAAKMARRAQWKRARVAEPPARGIGFYEIAFEKARREFEQELKNV